MTDFVDIEPWWGADAVIDFGNGPQKRPVRLPARDADHAKARFVQAFTENGFKVESVGEFKPMEEKR